MNLKDWQAMTPEEQAAYWDMATRQERRDLFLAAAKEDIKPRSVPPPDEGTSAVPTPGGSTCCELANYLAGELKDEEEAVISYSSLSGRLKNIGQDELADALLHIADDEFKHYLQLRGMVNILNEQCSCGIDKLGIPFGG